MIVRICLMICLFLVQSSATYGIEKVKFHPPESESEMALENVLRIGVKINKITKNFSETEYYELKQLIKAEPSRCITKYYDNMKDDDKIFCKTMFTEELIKANNDLIEKCIEDRIKHKFIKYAKNICQIDNQRFFVSESNNLQFYTINPLRK